MMSVNQSDQILVRSYLNGDESSFEVLIRKHKDKVFAFILSKIKNYNIIMMYFKIHLLKSLIL